MFLLLNHVYWIKITYLGCSDETQRPVGPQEPISQTIMPGGFGGLTKPGAK